MFWKWPISIIGKMLNIGADNRSTPNRNISDESIQHHHKPLSWKDFNEVSDQYRPIAFSLSNNLRNRQLAGLQQHWTIK